MHELYGCAVCSACHQAFLLKRIFAHVLDNVLYSMVAGIGVFIALFVAVGIGLASQPGSLSSSDPAASDAAATVATKVWIFSLLLLVLLRPMLDGFRGHSPGKAILGLQVIDSVHGRPANFWDSLQRNLVLLVPFMPLVILVQLLSGSGKRLGDGWARTRVIWKSYRRAVPFLPDRDRQARTLARA